MPTDPHTYRFLLTHTNGYRHYITMTAQPDRAAARAAVLGMLDRWYPDEQQAPARVRYLPPRTR